MTDLFIVADPDPDFWFAVPTEYPDPLGSDPAAWARAVAVESSGATEPPELLETLLADLARTEQGRDDGVAYVFLPRDNAPMQLVRLRGMPAEAFVQPQLPDGPLDPVVDVYDADLLGPAGRTIVAGRPSETSEDLLVTVVYHWTVGWMAVVLTLATLDPGEAVTMLGTLDAFADTVWVEDEQGELVRADPVAQPTGAPAAAIPQGEQR